MDIRILIACLVFFLLWRITISQQVSEPKDPHMKTYHGNHMDEMKKQSSLKIDQNEKNRKNIQLGQILGPVNFLNKKNMPEKKKHSKIFRIQPIVPSKRIFFKNAVKSQEYDNLTSDILKETNVTENEPKEEVINSSKDASAVSTDEYTPRTRDSQLRNKLENKSNNITSYNNTSPSKPAFYIDLPTSQFFSTTKPKITKTLQKLPSTEKPNPETKQDEIQSDSSHVTDEAICNKSEDNDSYKSKLYASDNKDDKEKPMKHPFLDAIQNDRYLMCSPQDAPNASVVADTTNIDDIELRFRDDRLSESPKTTLDQAVNLNIPDTDIKDEVEDVRINSCTFEEMSEISNTPQLTLEPEFNANNVPVLYMYNQVLKSIPLYNQLNTRTPDEQVIEKKDDKNINISYYQTPNGFWFRYNYQKPFKQNYQDSYYQPTTNNAKYGNHDFGGIPGIQNYWNNVYNTNKDLTSNSYAYYGYNGAQPQQLQNYWSGIPNYDRNRGINERIYRKWMNTQLYIKGKNAYKQFTTNNLSRSYDQVDWRRKA